MGATTTAQTPGRSCVAASTGIRNRPLTSTSEVQLCSAASPVSNVIPASTARSTNSANHAHRTESGPRRHTHQPKQAAQTAYPTTTA